MRKSNKTFLIFETNERFSSICSIKESKKGELIILPQFAENYSELEFGNSHNEKEIIDQHYTIHHSRKVNEDVNVLNHTLEFKNGLKVNTRIYTRAFNNRLFCPILTVRGQNFSNERYSCIKNNTDNYVNLGAYIPNESTVYYMIIATNPKNTFKNDYKDLNYINLNFKNYSLIILWSFGLIPSHFTGNKSHFLTIPEYRTQLQEGLHEDEIINAYRFSRQLQHSSFLEFIKKDIKFNDIDSVLIQSIGFKKKPNRNIDKSDKDKMNLDLGFYYFNQGKKAYKNGNHKGSLKCYLESEKIFKKHNKPISLADVLNSEGILYNTIGKPKKAIAAYNEALGIYVQFHFLFSIANTYLNLSMVFRDSMRIREAKDNIQKSILISEENNYNSLLSNSYRELGVLYKNEGNIILAEKYLSKALKTYKKDGNEESQAFCYGNLGLISLQKGKYKKSLELHIKALEVFKTLRKYLGVANETANVGNLNCILGNEEGIKQLFTALEMHKKNGYQYGIATDLKLIGYHQSNNNQVKEGVRNLEQSKKILLSIENIKEARNIKQLIEKIKAVNNI